MNILIIGLGSIGRKHVDVLQSLSPDSKVFALRSSQNSEAYLDVENIFSLNDLATIELDFAIVSNPTSARKTTLQFLSEMKIPIFIEKPLHDSLDIAELVQKLSTKGLITYVACNLRFLDSIQYLYDRRVTLRSSRLNEVNSYCGSYLPDWRPGIDFRSTYSANPALGGGVHLDLIHELDYLYWIFDMPIQVNHLHRNRSSLSIDSVDYANYQLHYDGFIANVIMNYYRKDPKRSLELVFENETWNIDLLENNIGCNGELIFESNQRIADTYKSQMEYFLLCLENDEIPFNTIADGYNVLRMCIEDEFRK